MSYKVKLDIINFDDFYNETRVVRNHKFLKKKKEIMKSKKIIDIKDVDTTDRRFTDDGLFSEKLFGRNPDNESLSYQCMCGKYKGNFMEGYLCEKCNTKVQFIEPNISKLAWIDLDKFYIINPVMYFLISKVIGNKNMKKILAYNIKVDENGFRLEDEKFPLANTGLIKFKENFDDIFEEFYETSTYADKHLVKNLVEKHRDKIFINHIPVYSSILRPANILYQDKTIFNFDEVNRNYAYLIKLGNLINETSRQSFDLSILTHLFTMQQKANLIFEKIIDNISGKSGFIRSKTMANRVNFSARNVITPLPPGYKMDEIVLPYLTFIELYSFHIINILCKIKNISENKAKQILERAKAKFDDEIYFICKDLINKTKNGIKILLNRNPSIEYGSILCLNVVDIKKNYHDLTTSMNNLLLASLSGDYDGDCLNIIAILDNELKQVFYDIFSPVNMFISRCDGKFNKDLSIDKDQVLGMHVFNA